MTKKMTKIAMMMVLAIGLMTSAAMAQIKGGGFGPIGIYSGIETAEGTFDSMTAIRYGNTFVLNSHGEWETHHLTVSIDYLLSGTTPNEGFAVVSGSWSLVVYRDNVYAGTLHGDILNGVVVFPDNAQKSPAAKRVQLSLRSTGGLGIFKGKSGEDIAGIYDARTDLHSKETQGTANFGF